MSFELQLGRGFVTGQQRDIRTPKLKAGLWAFGVFADWEEQESFTDQTLRIAQPLFIYLSLTTSRSTRAPSVVIPFKTILRPNHPGLLKLPPKHHFQQVPLHLVEP